VEDTRTAVRRQISTVLDEEDIAELEKIARQKRSSLAQVIREFVVAGIERERRAQAAEAVA
jgi:lauroyl/myristoyl acyltransferase